MAYLKNLAASLSKRTLPTVGRSIFNSENSKYSDIMDKVTSAREIFNSAKNDIKNTTSPLTDGTIGKQLRKQISSGNFGTSKEDQDKVMFESMGFDNLDSIENFSIGHDDDSEDSSSGTTNKITQINVQNRVANSLNSIGKGDALVSENITFGTAVATNIGRHQIGIMSAQLGVLNNIHGFMVSNVNTGIEAQLEFYKLQTSLNDKFNDLMDPMTAFYKNEVEKMEKARSKAIADNYGIGDAALDPSRMLSKLTDSAGFQALFGENNGLKGLLSNAANDPIGTILAMGIAGATTRIFGSVIDSIHTFTETIGYRAQATFEEWSSRSEKAGFRSGFNKDSILASIGSFLKADREGDNQVALGQFSKEAVAFDGKTRKAIVDVIPMYLSKILRAVSKGKDYEVYDYEKAKFISANKGSRELQRSVAYIDRGLYAGGLGSLTNSGLLETNASTSEKKKIQKELIKQALSKDFHKIDPTQLAMADPRLQSVYSDMISKMSPVELREFKKGFLSYKYDRLDKLGKLNRSIESSGMEQSAILRNKNFALRNETTNDFIRAIAEGRDPAEERMRNVIDGPRKKKDPISAQLDSLRTSIRRKGLPDPLAALDGNQPIDPKNMTLVDKIYDKFGSMYEKTTNKALNVWDKITTSFDKATVGIKKMLLGTDNVSGKSDDEISKTSLFEATMKRVDMSVLKPFKILLLGKKEFNANKDITLLESIKKSFNDRALVPFKIMLLGKKEFNKNTDITLFQTLNKALDEKILNPLKFKLLGNDGFTKKSLKEMSFLKAIGTKFDSTVLMPFKNFLLGGNASQTQLKKISFLKSLEISFGAKILDPIKNMLVGGDEKKFKKLTFMQAIGDRFTLSVLNPVKKALLNNGTRSDAEIFKTSFFATIGTAFKEKLVQPINEMLFGKDRRTNGFFKNLGETFSPFFNKLLFGYDKASKNGLIENLKESSKSLWNNIWGGVKNNFFNPLRDNIKELFGPVFKEFKSTFADEMKYYWGRISGSVADGVKTGSKGFLDGAKGIFRNIFGDETVDLLRKNVLTPLNDLTTKLTDSMSKVFKFLLRIPVNFMKGVTDSLKLQRLNSGRGNYSAEEVTRLRDKEKAGNLFNFLDLGSNNASKKSEDVARQGILSRLGEALSGRKIKTVSESSGSITFDNRDKEGQGKNANSALASIRGVNASINDNGSNANNSTIARIRARLRGQSKDGSDSSEEGSLGHINVGSGSVNAPVRARNGIIGAINGPKLQGNITAINTKLDTIAPAILSTSNTTSRVLEFMKSNLSRVDGRLENIFKLMKKNSGISDLTGVSGTKGKISFLFNPFGWMINKVGGIVDTIANVSTSLFNMVGKLSASILSIPGKIVGSVTNAISASINLTMKAFSGVIQASGKVVTGLIDGVGIAIKGVTNAAGAMLNALGNTFASLVTASSKIAESLINAGTEVTGIFIKGMVPVLGNMINLMSKAANGLMDFVSFMSSTAWKLGKGMIGLMSRVAGSVFGIGEGKNGVLGLPSFSITNFLDLFKMSKFSPMHVQVVGGHVGTYAVANPGRSTKFIDKNETRSLLGKTKKEEKEDKENSLLSNLAGTLAGSFLGSALGKLAGSAKDLVGSVLGSLGSKVKIPGKVTEALGSIGNKIRGVGGIVKTGKKGGIVDKLAENADLIGDAADLIEGKDSAKKSSGSPKSPKKGGLGSRIANSIKNIKFGSFVKGIGLSAVVGGVGSFAADTLFEKGGAANDIFGSAAEYAGWGGLAGSIIPGIGTGVGMMIGGVVGAVKAAVPRFIKWIETTFQDQIQSATETFISFPEKVTAWVNELPEKVDAFAKAIPEKIMTLFAGDAASESSKGMTLDANGQIAEDKPSLLGRMFSAMGQAVWQIGKAMPKMIVGVGEGIVKTLITGLVGGVSMLGKSMYMGFTALGMMGSKLFDSIVLKARNKMFIDSDEETAQKLKDLDKQYEDKAKAQSDNFKVFDTFSSDVSATLTNWSIADKMKLDDTTINKNRAIYAEVTAASQGDRNKALELFRSKTQGMDSDAQLKEFQNQEREAQFRDKTSLGKGVEMGMNGEYSMNKGASSAMVPLSQKYTSDPGLFTSADVDKAITMAAEKYGIPKEVMNAYAQIESSKRYWVSNGSYTGLFQMGKAEFAKFSPNPNGSIIDPYLNAMAAGNYASYHASELRKRGLPVTPEMIYLAHQQGLGGVSQIYNAAAKGQPLSASIARNMTNNPPHDGKGATSDPKDFLNRWSAIVSNKANMPFKGVPGVFDGVPQALGGKGPLVAMDQVKANNGTSPEDLQMSAMVERLSNSQPMMSLNALANGNGANSVIGRGPVVTVPTEAAKAAGVTTTANSEIASVSGAKTGADTVVANTNSAEQIKNSTESYVKASMKPEVAPVETVNPADALTKELSAQTAILRQIEANTKATSENFFDGEKSSSKSSDDSNLASKVNRANDRALRQVTMANDNFPDYLQPGKGANLVSKAGTKNI